MQNKIQKIPKILQVLTKIDYKSKAAVQINNNKIIKMQKYMIK
jgi:hypothetical protein